MMSRWRRAVRQLWRQDVIRSRPAGLCHWRLFWPGGGTRIRQRRMLWLGTRYRLPWLLWLPLEVLRYTLWRFWFGPRCVALALAAVGQRLQNAPDVDADALQAALTRWVRDWAMPVPLFLRWQLHQPQSDALAYVLPGETRAYHAWRNRPYAGSRADARRLADKYTFAKMLEAEGVPMVPTLCCSHGAWQDLHNARSEAPAVFCKQRSGSNGQDAFFVHADGCGAYLDGACINSEAALHCAWQKLSRHGPVLIQPLLENHPALAAYAAEARTITVRVITRRQSGRMRVAWAFVEVPTAEQHVGQRLYTFLPVEISSGRLRTLPGAPSPAAEMAKAIGVLPDWSVLVRESQRAHRRVPELWAVAWDWVLTPNGPVLLEGNAGWGLNAVQDRSGGVLPKNP